MKSVLALNTPVLLTESTIPVTLVGKVAWVAAARGVSPCRFAQDTSASNPITHLRANCKLQPTWPPIRSPVELYSKEFWVIAKAVVGPGAPVKKSTIVLGGVIISVGGRPKTVVGTAVFDNAPLNL
jgi:hypothetical protein